MIPNKLLKFTISAIFICMSHHVVAQKIKEQKAPENIGSKEYTNNYVIEYDFSTGLYNKNIVKPKVHFPVMYRIKNINRYAYKIEIKSKDSILAFSFALDGLSKETFIAQKKEQEAIIASMNETTKPITAVNSNDVKDVVGKKPEEKIGLVQLLNSTVQISELNRQIIVDSEKLKTLSESIINNAKSLNLLNIDKNRILFLKDSIQNEINKFDTIKDTSDLNVKNWVNLKKMSKIIDEQQNLIDERDKLNKNIADSKIGQDTAEEIQGALIIFLKDSDKLSELFSLFRQTFREVNKINLCHQRLFEVISYHQLTFDTVEDKVKEFKKEQKNDFKNYQDQIGFFKSRYYDLQVQYGILKRNFLLNDKLSESGQSKLYGQADDYMDRAKNMFDRINLIEVQKKLNLMPIIIESLSNEDTFNFISPPIEPIGDVVTFDIDIQAKNKTEEKILNERKFKHEEFTYGGTRIDFGLGLAASYFGNTPVYELQVKNIENITEISIQKKSNQLFVPSLIGIVSMNYRSSHYTCYGGSAGLGIDVVNGKIQLSNFFAGPSITFGRYERLTFTAGASLRNVQQLKSGYEIGSKVTETSEDIENYLTDMYKIGLFASLTFVLTKGVKENIKKIPAYR